MLDSIFDDAEREFSRYATRKLSEAVKTRLEEWKHLNPDAEKIKTDIKSSHPFNKKTREIEVHCKSKRKFTAKTFGELFANPEIENEKPLFATATIRNGDAELKIKLLGQFVVNEIGGSISPNLSFTQRLIRQVKDWAEDRRRLEWYRKLAIPFGSLGIGFVTMALMSISRGCFTTHSDKSVTINNSRELLRDGIRDSDIPKAVEALLKLHVNDFNIVTVLDIKPWFITLLVVAIGLLLLGVLCPKSTLGLGLQEKRIKRIEFFTGKIWFWISAWIFAIGTSALGTVLFDLIASAKQNPG